MINFLCYVGSALVLWIVGFFIFEFSTKNKEFKLIEEGNKAAAYVLGGRALGLGIVLYSAISHASSILDMLKWGGIGIVTQIIAFYVIEWVTPKFDVTESIKKDNQAMGIILMFTSISIGLIVAACLVP